MPDTGVEIGMKNGESVTLGTTLIRTRQRLGELLKNYNREAG